MSDQKEQFVTGAQRDTEVGKARPDLMSPFFENVVGEALRKGGGRYGDRNWEKGIPISRSFASLRRHLMQWYMGDETEDHLANAACNLMFIIHTREMIKRGATSNSLNDMPDYTKKGNSHDA